MTTLPAIVLTVACTFINVMISILRIISGNGIMPVVISLLEAGAFTYVLCFVLGLITVCTEWKKIHAKASQKILHLFTFPFFLLTYIPITLVALFKKVEWEPIYHKESKTLAEVRGK